jgi:hypothetical protein
MGKLIIPIQNTGEVSDGFHTFNELYNHRMTLFIALCKQVNGFKTEVWRSKNHSNGIPCFNGEWFVLGINTEEGKQITYHLPISRWDEAHFAKTLHKAPIFDGHTPGDVLDRIKKQFINN